MTVEELVAQGFDRETAEKIVANSASSSGNTSTPFDVIKFNYDKEDILAEVGVKKGEFIAGWKINKENFSIEEEGIVFEKPMEFIVVASAYQYSTYDPKKGGYGHITPLFTELSKAKSVVDTKTGMTVGELKEQGVQLKFNNIMLILVKREGEWQPYLIYIRGINYGEWQKQLEERGLSNDKIIMKNVLKVGSKRIATKSGIPAWIMTLEDVSNDVPFGEIVSAVTPSIKKFDEWRNASNGTPKTNSGNVSVDTAADVTETEENTVADNEVDTEFED